MVTVLCLGGNPARVPYAAGLVAAIPGSHLIVSSDSPYTADLEGIATAGLTPDQYTLDMTAWDTVTNFTNTVPLVKKLGTTDLYVVTDGFHMLRAMSIATLVYFKTGIAVSAHRSSPADHQESKRLVALDTARAALYRITNQTLYDQTVYNDRVATYYNDYFGARNAGAPVSPR